MQQIREMATFAAVGLAATLVHIVCAILLIEQAGLSPWLANLLAFVLAMPIGYAGHANLTFATGRPGAQARMTPRSFGRFARLTGAGFALNQFSIVILVEHFALPHRPVLVATAFGVAGLVYLASKFWAFSQEPARTRAA